MVLVFASVVKCFTVNEPDLASVLVTMGGKIAIAIKAFSFLHCNNKRDNENRH